MSVQSSAVPMSLEVMSEKMRVGRQRLQHLDQGQQVRNREKELEKEVRNLTTMIESMHAKEMERLGQAEHDKRTLKRILDERSQEALQSMQLANVEIHRLKAELAAFQRPQQQALEALRQELTSKYEHIIRHKEEQYVASTSETRRQFAALDRSLDQVRVANQRLLEEHRQCQENNQQLLAESSSNEQVISELRAGLEGLKQSKEALEQDLRAQLTALQLEAKHNAEEHTKEITALQTHARVEVERCKEAALEQQRIGELLKAAVLEADALKDQLATEQHKSNKLAQKNETLQSEMDQLSDRLTKAAADRESLLDEKERLERECRSHAGRVQALELKMADVSGQYDAMHQRHVANRELAEKRAGQVIEEMRDKLRNVQHKHCEALMRLEQLHREDMDRLTQLHKQTLAECEARGSQAAQALKDKDNAIAMLSGQLSSAQRDMADQRSDINTLRLRLASQNLPSQPLSASGTLNSLDDLLDGLSPMMSPVRGLRQKSFSPRRDGAVGALTEENANLKAALKEMRYEMEQLLKLAGSAPNHSQLEDTPKRLEQCREEIMRLRNERKRLQDANQELRAALQEAGQELQHDKPPDLDAILDCIAQPGTGTLFDRRGPRSGHIWPTQQREAQPIAPVGIGNRSLSPDRRRIVADDSKHGTKPPSRNLEVAGKAFSSSASVSNNVTKRTGRPAWADVPAQEPADRAHGTALLKTWK